MQRPSPSGGWVEAAPHGVGAIFGVLPPKKSSCTVISFNFRLTLSYNLWYNNGERSEVYEYQHQYYGFYYRSKSEFFKSCPLVDQYGSAVVLKNNTPRYLIIDFAQADELQAAADDDVLAVSKKLMERNKAVYEELAK